MTKAQYRRLLIVIAVPMLIAGAIFTRVVVRPDNYATILCDNSTIVGESCQTTDGFGDKWDEQLRSKHPAWFDIKTRPHEENSFPYAMISGSQRYMSGIRIVSVSPYHGTDESPGSPLDALRTMSGQEIAIVFGNNEGDAGQFNALGCNELTFEDSGDTYTAGLCGIPNGLAMVQFTASSETSKQLSELKEKIDHQIETERRDIIIDYAIGIPLFLILFLLGSALVWAVKRATSYVRTG